MDPGVETKEILAGAQGHGHFFKGTIPGPFTDPVDRTFDLAGPAAYSGKGVCNCQTEIIMAMGGKGHRICILDPGGQESEQVRDFLRRRITDCIGDIDSGSPRSDCRLNHLFQIGPFGADGVFGRKLDIIRIFQSQDHTPDRAFNDLILIHFQFVFPVQGRGGDKGMDPPLSGILYRPARGVDIAVITACQRANSDSSHLTGDGADGIEISG